MSLLASNDEALQSRLRLAVESHDKYLTSYPTTNERLWSSSNPSKDPQLPWLALIDALCENDFAVELDWKTEAADVEFSLHSLRAFSKLSDSFKAWLKLQVAHADPNVGTGEFLQMLSKKLDEEKTTLLCLVMDSDSYIVAIAPHSSVPKLKELARSIDQKIVSFSDEIP